jgi:hypothetical protein
MIIQIQKEPYAEATIPVQSLKKELRDFNIEQGVKENMLIRYNTEKSISNTELKQMAYCLMDWGSMIEVLNKTTHKEIRLKFSMAFLKGFKIYRPKQIDVGYEFEFEEQETDLWMPFISQDLIKNTNFDIKNLLSKLVYIYTTEKGEVLKWNK